MLIGKEMPMMPVTPRRARKASIVFLGPMRSTTTPAAAPAATSVTFKRTTSRETSIASEPRR